MATAQKCPIVVASMVRGLATKVQSLLPGVSVTDIPVNDDSTLPDEYIPELDKSRVLFCDPPTISQVITRSDISLKWVHSTWAGVEKVVSLVQEKQVTPNFVLTRTGESFGQLIGEYVVGHVIAQERRFRDLYKSNEAKQWERSFNKFRSLSTLTIGVLGFGQIGKEIAKMCKAMGMCTWALSRSQSSHSPAVDFRRGPSELGELLSHCDYVCNILPSTAETRGLLSGDVLASCQTKKSVFINVGRGDVIDEASLVNALKQEWLGGAILDVFPVEPLPVSSPLWTMPNVTISPHCSGPSHQDQVAREFVNNYHLFCEGKQLKYQIDWIKGY